MYTCINDLISAATRAQEALTRGKNNDGKMEPADVQAWFDLAAMKQQVSEPVSRRAHNPQSPVQLRNLLPISSDQNNYAEGCDSGKRTLGQNR